MNWMNIGQAADYAGVHRDTFRPWLADGLRHIRKGSLVRIRQEWVDDYLLRFENEKKEEVDLDAILEGVI